MIKLLKEILSVLVVLIILVQASSVLSFDRLTKASLYETASRELLEILEKMPPGGENGYGFNDRYEFSRAELGIPYQEYSLLTMEPTSYWRIPVTVDGENRALVKYRMVEGEWQWAGFGAARLARELGRMEKSRSKQPKSGKIIRDYKFACDYIQFDAESEKLIEGELIPLETAKRFLKSVISENIKSRYKISEVKELRSLRLSK